MPGVRRKNMVLLGVYIHCDLKAQFDWLASHRGSDASAEVDRIARRYVREHWDELPKSLQKTVPKRSQI